MTLLGTWNTYYAKTNTNTPARPDARGTYKVYYEYQSSQHRYKVNVECYLRRVPDIWDDETIAYGAVSGNIRASVNGTNGSQTSYSKSFYYSTSSSITLELITTQTFYVYPDASTGKSSVSFSGRIEMKLGSTASVTRTCSHTWSLPTVAVSSSVSNNTSSSSRINFGSNVTFTITPPAGSSGLTHTLKYTVGGTEYTIPNVGSNTTITYAFPETLITNYPTNRYPSITVTCTSSNNTTSTTEVYLQVPDTDIYRPTISIALSDAMSNKPSALDGMWIKNKSLLEGTITATAKSNATIDENKYVSSISGFSTSYYTNPFTTVALTVAGSRTITYSATDSRGLTKTSTQAITVVDYTTPSISSAKVERCNSDGTLNESGTYGKVTVTYSVSPLNNGSENKNTKTLTVKKDSDTAQTITTTNYSGTVSQVFPFSLTENSTYTFTLTLTDIFGSTTYTFTLGTAFKTVSKRAGGKGIAFGKVATQDGFDCNMNAIFRGTLTGTLTGSATSAGTATTATKLGSSTVGSTSTPIYLNAGSPSQCTDLTITTGKTTVGNITWDWIKLGNGYAVCFGRRQVSTTINTTWGNLKTSSNISLDNYPFTFTELPTITFSITTGDTGSAFPMNVAATIPTTSNPGGISLVRGSALTTTQKFIINITAWGKWK